MHRRTYHPTALGLPLLLMLLATTASAQELVPPAQLKKMPIKELPAADALSLNKRVLGSWKITGYHAWDRKNKEYIEVAKRRDTIGKTVETWMFRRNGTFRHILSKNLWFSGRWEIKQALGGTKNKSVSHDIVLAVDVSGTMKGAPMAAARKAALGLLGRVGKSSRVALVTFGSKVETLGFDSKPKQLRQRIAGLKATAMKTRLYDGLKAAIGLARRARNGAGTIVLLSDGKDEGSDSDLLDLLELAESAKSPIHAIGFSRVEKRYLTSMKSFAKVSNGSFGSATQAQALGDLLNATFQGFVPATADQHFVLRTYKVRGSIPTLRREEDWFIGTWLDEGRDLVVYYVGERWDLSHRNSLSQAHRFEPVRYGER